MRLRLLAVAILTVGVGLAVPAGQAGQRPGQPPAQQQQQQQPPVIKAGINFVSVDVIVTDKKTGNVVLDLKPGDFDVREDKKPQKVQTFSVVRIDPSTEPTEPPKDIKNSYDEETEAKKPDVRLFVILLDDYHVRRGNDLAVRRPLIDFLQNDLAPQDMVAIMYPLTPVTDLSFSRNREAEVDAINHFIGRKNDYTPRNSFEDRYSNYPTDQVEEIRNEVTMDALRGAAVKLGGMRDGRKSIIFVSEGFIATLPPQLSSPNASAPGVGSAPPGVDAPNDPRSTAQQFFNSVDLTNRLREVYDTLNRNNTSLYAVDPRGLAATEYGIEQGVNLRTDQASLRESLDTLHVLADNSDGRAIVNRNDLGTAMKQIVRDSSGYYLLGYTSTSAPTDGKFHTIDVKVNRPGVEVRARKGYWAYTNEEAAAAKAPAAPTAPSKVMDALNAVAEPARGDRAAQFWIGSRLDSAGQPQVTFAWEPLPPAPGQRAADLPSTVRLNAMGQDGTPLFNGRVGGASAVSSSPQSTQGASGADTAAANQTPGASVSFKAPAGQVQLRMTVEGADGKVIDSDSSTVTVPDYAKVSVALSTPRLYRARTAHDMLLLRHNPDAPPTASRDFSRIEQILIRFDAYAAGGPRPDVTARLLNRGGKPMADVPIQSVAGQPFLIDFPLASLAAGEYVIEIDAKSPSGTAQQLVAFRITG